MGITLCNANQKAILVVDDDPLNRRLLSVLLQRLGHVVTEAPSAEVAIDKLQNGNFKLVLMDDFMPGMTGLQALELLRSSTEPQLKNMPVVMCTGNDQPQDQQRYHKAGSDGFLTKPTSVRALESMLAQALHCSRAQLLG